MHELENDKELLRLDLESRYLFPKLAENYTPFFLATFLIFFRIGVQICGIFIVDISSFIDFSPNMKDLRTALHKLRKYEKILEKYQIKYHIFVKTI